MLSIRAFEGVRGPWLAAISAAALLTGCTASGSRPQAAGKRGDMAVPVATAAVAVKDVPLDIQVIGNVEAFSTVSIKAQVTGQLQKAHFKEGDFVRKGDVLFSIDPNPFQANLEEAQANFERSQAQLAQAEANLKRDIAQARYARAQAGRYGELFRQGIMSREQTEQSEASADAQAEGVRADEAAIKSARAAVGAAQSAVSTSKIQLGYTTIRSPLDGRTGNMAVKEGNLVSANQTELITINQVQPVYVTFGIPETRLTAVKQYMAQGRLPVLARPQDDNSGDETGVLSFVDNTVDPGTGTIKLKGTFANPSRKLWPGQFVRVTLRLARVSNALVVPNQAVQTGQDGLFVYVVKSDQTVESRPVTTGTRVDQEVVVESGLNRGETVVTEGHLRLAPGMRVRVRAPEGGGGRKRPIRT